MGLGEWGHMSRKVCMGPQLALSLKDSLNTDREIACLSSNHCQLLTKTLCALALPVSCTCCSRRAVR